MRRTGRDTLAVLCAVVFLTAVFARPARAQQAARIDTVSPSQAAAGQAVTITGIGFGARNVRITVGGIPAQVVSATGSRVTFLVPTGVACGPTVITATNPGGHTGRIAFAVCVSANAPPVASAGPDLLVYLPATATLNGAVSDDGLPPAGPLTIQWSQVSGPGTVTFSNAANTSTTASFSEAGTYVLRLTASDTEFTTSDETTVTVYPANQAPVVNAGPDLVVYLPATATPNGTVTDDGLPPGSTLSIQWSKLSGPGTVTFSNATSASTTASFSEAGTYVLRLTANDTEFTTGDETTITVHPVNQPPVVNAGPDLVVYLPATATVTGTVTDDGLPPSALLTVQWSQVSGPGTVTISNTTSASTTASFSEAGSYVLRLTASDSELSSSDETTINVSPANRAPIANAGDDFTIGVTRTAHLDGGASGDPDGDPLTFSWAFVTIPAGSSATLAGPTTAAPAFVIDRPGTYVVRLVVNDGVLDSEPEIGRASCRERV